jgi:hypothetical protein
VRRGLTAAMVAGLLAGAAEAETSPPPDVQPYVRALCGQRPCCVLNVVPAGTGPKGETLEVVRLDMAGPPGKASCAPMKPWDPKWEYQPIFSKPLTRPGVPAPVLDLRCHPYEFHLTVKVGGSIVRRQKLLEICNEYGGAEDQGADGVAALPAQRLFQVHHSGGSHERNWTSAAFLGLAPPRVVSNSEESFKGSGLREQTEWDWDQFRGETDRNLIACRPDGQPIEGGAGQEARTRAVLIPRVTLPESFRLGGWKTTSLGGCAVKVDGDVWQGGFVVHGEPSVPEDALLRVVASPQNELYIEIQDDVLVGPGAAIAGKSWVTDDHVEIWTSSARHVEFCRDDAAPAQQWAIRLTDGKMFAGHGNPVLPSVPPEVARHGHLVHLKVPAVTAPYVTVVFSDSDEGKRQDRLLATSAVSFGKAASLGTFFDVPESRASCVPDGKGGLRPKVRPPVLDPDKALWQPEKP